MAHSLPPRYAGTDGGLGGNGRSTKYSASGVSRNATSIRAVGSQGQAIDVLLRDKRDQASAEAFFRQAVARREVTPSAVITDHHQPYVKAVATVIPFARHVRTGPHRRRGDTTQPIERSNVPIRDRLRGGRGLRTVRTGQRFLKSFVALHALRRGAVKLRPLVPGYQPTQAPMHETARAIVVAMDVLGS